MDRTKDKTKYLVKSGILTLEKEMTYKQAMSHGVRNMPPDLKAAGFACVVGKSDQEMHGGVWLRISYGYDRTEM